MPLSLNIEDSVVYQRGIEKGIEKTIVQAVLGLYNVGLPKEQIATGLKISVEKVSEILEKHSKK